MRSYLVSFLTAAMLMRGLGQAEAIPAFATQTGMPCDTCHQPHNPGMDAPPAETAAKAPGGAK